MEHISKRFKLLLLSCSVTLTGWAGGADSLRRVQLDDLRVQMRWVNPAAIHAYLDDTGTGADGEASMLHEKLSRLESLLPQARRILSGDASDEAVGKAREVLALKREILLSNPLLDMDKVIVAVTV